MSAAAAALQQFRALVDSQLGDDERTFSPAGVNEFTQREATETAGHAIATMNRISDPVTRAKFAHQAQAYLRDKLEQMPNFARETMETAASKILGAFRVSSHGSLRGVNSAGRAIWVFETYFKSLLSNPLQSPDSTGRSEIVGCEIDAAVALTKRLMAHLPQSERPAFRKFVLLVLDNATKTASEATSRDIERIRRSFETEFQAALDRPRIRVAAFSQRAPQQGVSLRRGSARA